MRSEIELKHENQIITGISHSTMSNLRDVINDYYNIALQRCSPLAARIVARNKLIADIEEFITNWEYAKS